MKSKVVIRMFKVHEAHRRVRTACTLLILSVATAITSQAQTYNVLTRLVPGDGQMPKSLVQGPDGNFYGVGAVGGHNGGGSIFKVSPAGTVTPLYMFCATKPCRDGSTPNGIVLASDGNFYGTTRSGGTANAGTIFVVSPAGGSVGTLYSFCASKVVCADGVFPEGELIQGTDGALYGTTFLGGTHDGGTVFKITLSGDFTSLYSFCSKSNCADGAHPLAGLVEANNGLFYGTTGRGGSVGSCQGPDSIQGCGTLFRINSTGSSFTTLYNFCVQPNCADGSLPETSLIQAADGKIYGTTGAGAD